VMRAERRNGAGGAKANTAEKVYRHVSTDSEPADAFEKDGD
jgi:hypothetical protein